MNFDGVKVTWLGHGTFVFTTPEGKKILIDPWLEGNPACPKEFHDFEADAILVTHGHFDHIGDIFTAHERNKGPLVAIFDLTTWLGTKGVSDEHLVGMNIGGTYELEGFGVQLRMTPAVHSASYNDEGTMVDLGDPAGYVMTFSNGKRFYVAGDTTVFGDMALIARLEQPDVAILPIGDFFTMDPRYAAYACELLDVDIVIPGHFDTFPALTGTPAQLEEELAKLHLTTKVVTAPVGEEMS